MCAANIRELYDEAWHELFDLVAQRSMLLHALDSMSRLAMNITPTTGLVIEFEVTRAEQLVAAIDNLTPLISAGIQTVNGYAEQCGRPTIKWQHVALGSDAGYGPPRAA